MKKVIVNFISIFIIFLEIFNTNLVFAQKIVCEVEDKYGTTRLFLMQYNDDDEKEGWVWSYVFWFNGEISDEEKRFLEQINGETVNDNDSRYDKILKLSKELHDLGYHPAMGYIPPNIASMNMNMFEILRSLLEINQ